MSRPDIQLATTPIDGLREYEARHNLQFVEPNQPQLERFVEVCQQMLNNPNVAHDVTFDQTLITVPDKFLSSSLEVAQRASINQLETAEVAAISVRMQEQLLQVPVKESMERMVHLPDTFLAHSVFASFSDNPFHAACGEWAGKQRQFWVREGFAQRLAVLGSVVTGVELGLHVEDAFRPVGVQEGLFKRRVAWTVDDHPDWSKEQIITEAKSKTAVTPRLASHKAGAAVDLRLMSTTGLLDIGHEYPDGGALVYSKTPFVTQEQWQNRQLLMYAARLAGLALYVGEDWHLSYGDNLASLDDSLMPKPGYVAKYGPIKSFSLTSGEIIEVYDQTEVDQVFDI